MTRRVRVDLGTRGYDAVVGTGALDEVATVLAGRRRVAVVAPPTVDAELVRGPLREAGIVHEVFEIADGEAAKTLATVERLCRDFATWGLLRVDAVVALGGGVVCDTAGFAASVYHRGVGVVQVPTTLLAMVDAAIGGKTGVNLPEGKNLVGTFHQPLAVLADPTVIATLPDVEYRCGLGEVAKYALMERDDRLIGAAGALVARDAAAVGDVVARCVEVKARHVAADEHERTGMRAALNYGHTLAHALETVTRHALRHGEAVAIGLVFAAHLAGALGRIDAAAVAAHEKLVGALDLPRTAPAGLHRDELLAIMARDKKSGGGLTFVLHGPGGIGRVDDPDPRALERAFRAVGIER